MNFTFLRILFFLGCFGLSCSSLREPPPEDFFTFLRVDIVANYNANQGNTIPLDLVFVYDENFLAQLQTMTAEDWFAYRRGSADIPESQAFWLSLEIGPGQNRSITNFPNDKNKALALVLFADYQTDGLHRSVVETMHSVSIRLQETEFVVIQE